MKTKKEILYWSTQYDTKKYPVNLYDELVVNGADHPEKFVLMGSWKTGTIKAVKDGTIYIDKDGNKYAFTKRWAHHTPVGKDTWQYISDNIAIIKQQVPETFPKEEPAIVKELISRKGFGYIWALFTLHCIYPTVYPLYDQHVYRAFRNHVSEGKENPLTASNTWAAYAAYRIYFLNLLKEHAMEYQILDRAVWTYGKSLKKSDGGNSETVAALSYEESSNEDDWIHSFTLGDKAKSFWWRMDTENNIHILRNEKTAKKETISHDDLDRIVNYVTTHDWVKLANSVSKLGDGTEGEGLGKFMFENIRMNTTFAQLSSHLVSIFSHAGVWQYNGAKRGILVKHFEGIEWQETLRSFFLGHIYDIDLLD